MCQRTIAEYEEELCPTKEEKERQHEKHQVVLHRTDIHQLIGHQEECLPHLQGDSFTLEYPQPSHFKGDKKDAQPSYFKEEEEGECPVGQEEADVSKFPLTVVSVKTEEHEDKPPESSQLHHSPNVCEEHFLPEQQKWSFRMRIEELQPSHIKKEEEYPLIPHFKMEEEDPQTPHFKDEKEDPLTLYLKEEAVDPLTPHFKEEEEDPLTPNFKEKVVDPLTPHIKEEEEDPLTPHIKEEEEELSIGQEGEHLEGLEEVDVTKMPVTGVPVKSEDDEVKGESEERGGGEPPSSSSTQHMTTEADGDHCGGSQADKLLAPLSDSEDTTSHSPDTDDEDSKDDKTCHTDNTHFTSSHSHKTFKYHCSLKEHMRTHTGENLFPAQNVVKVLQQMEILNYT
ncbi:FK506-binding protein 5-like isoform X2 [Nerophis ophidion]|uniref:FK506-binding protein 5-like isoform X2 n=1 Tax=Nerophis ophidion TaxID=159077 RepID=UPI002AE078F0|nr:FK506-binding protein 5-like isoform X2 [Nerophis ophidion]